MEIHKGCPILYSLGNFAFWQDHSGLFHKLGIFADIPLPPEGGVSVRLLPYRLEPESIRALAADESEWFGLRLGEVSGPALHPDNVQAAWQAAIDAIPLSSWYHDCTGMAYGMRLMENEDPLGLARLRTRLSSPSHYEFMTAGINRILSGWHGHCDSAHSASLRLWTEASAAGPFS